MTKVYGKCHEEIGAFNDTKYIVGMLDRVCLITYIMLSVCLFVCLFVCLLICLLFLLCCVYCMLSVL